MALKRDPTLTIRANDKTKGAFKSVGTRLGQFRKSALSAGVAIAGLIGAAGFGAIIKSSLDAADRIGKLSDRIGASTEALSEYKHVAELSGVAFNTLAIGLQRMTRRVSEAAAGSGEARDAIKELGLSAVELNKLRPDQQFEAFADALNKVESETDRVRLGFKLFDSEGVALLQTMTKGAAGIREMREEAQALGLTLSRDQVDAAEQANDAITKLQASFQGVAQSLSIELAPHLTDLLDWLRIELPAAVDVAQKQLESFYDFLFPSEVQGQGIEDALANREILIGKINAAESFGRAHLIPQIQQELDQQNLIIDMLQRKKKIIEENQALAVKPPPAPVAEAAQADLALERQETDRRSAIIYFALRKQDADDARAAELEAAYAFEDAKWRAVQNGYKRTLAFSKLSAQEQTKTVVGELVKTTQGVAQQNKAMFKINQVAGIANAIINTHEGVSRTLAKYPWPLAGALAAVHLAAGIAQINAIRQASFGGGSAPSLAGVGGGAATVNTVPAGGFGDAQDNNRAGTVTIIVEGNVYANDDFRAAMVEALNEADRNDEVRINAN